MTWPCTDHPQIQACLAQYDGQLIGTGTNTTSESNHAWRESECRSSEPLRPILVDMVRQFREAGVDRVPCCERYLIAYRYNAVRSPPSYTARQHMAITCSNRQVQEYQEHQRPCCRLLTARSRQDEDKYLLNKQKRYVHSLLTTLLHADGSCPAFSRLAVCRQLTIIGSPSAGNTAPAKKPVRQTRKSAQKSCQHARLSVSSKSAQIRPHARHLCDTAAAGSPEQDPCIDSSDAIMLDNLQENNVEGRCLHMYTGMCEQPNFKVCSVPTQQQRISNPVALTRVVL